MANNKPIDKSYLVKQLKNYETEIIDKKYVTKDSVATTLEAEVTDEQVASALLAKTELDKKIDKTSIVTELSDSSTDDEVVGALTTYNELQKLESANKEQFAIASGEFITVNDSVDGNIVELGIKGNSFQQTYTGKNLLSKTNISYNATGLTITDNKNGTYDITSGTTTGTEFRLVGAYNNLTKEIHLDTSKTYKITAKIGSANLSTICVFTDGSTYTNVNSTQNLFTLPDGFEDISSIFIRFDSSASYSGTLEVMLYEYTEGIDETFEPYVGGIPSPNPLYPQTINSVGDDGSLVVKSCGKNLIKNSYTSRVVGGLTITVNKDGTINLNGTYKGTSTHFYNLDSGLSFADYLDNRKLRKGKYVLSFEYEGELSSNFYFFIRDDYTAPYTDFARVYKSDTNKSFSLTEDTNTRMYLRIGTNEVFDNVIIKPMLRRCDENGVPYGDNIFEPYHETTTTIPLSEPLRAIGDVKDEITYQDGKWGVLRRFKKYTFDGSDEESWILGSTNNFNDVSFTAYIDGLEPVTYKDSWICVPSLCDRFSKKDFLYQNTITDECYMVTSTANANRFSIRLLKSRVSEITVDAVKVWLASNPITVWYELKTPVFEPFADQTLPYLSTYDGVTNISNDDALSAEMTVKYPTTDASGVGSRNESRIAELAKDTDDKFDDVNESLSVIGKCKNLLKPTLQTTTQNGVTCTNNGDGTYTLNGTATKGVTLYISGSPTKNTVGGYKLLGCPINGSEDTYRIVVSYYNNEEWKAEGSDLGNGVIIDGTYSRLNYLIKVESGTTLTNLIFKPMLTTNLSATYDDFVPYTGDGETLTHDVAEIKNDLGSTDISAIGDGTVTGAISAVNNNLANKVGIINLSQSNIGYVRESDTVQYVYINVLHPNGLYKWTLKIYTVHPTLKCEFMQSTDGTNWTSVWTIPK